MSNAPEAIITKPLKGPHARRRFTKHLVRVQQLLEEAIATKGTTLLAQLFFQKQEDEKNWLEVNILSR